MKYHKNFLFGAPIRKVDEDKFLAAMEQRFNGDMEKTYAYIQHEAERQITKASGLLSCASILAGLSYFIKFTPSIILALVAILLAVGSFYSKWPINTEVITDLRVDFERMFYIMVNRCIANALSTFLIIAAVMLLVLRLLNLI